MRSTRRSWTDRSSPVGRRAFIGRMSGAAGAMAVGLAWPGAAAAIDAMAQSPAGRRQATVGGRRVTVVDVHAHVFVPEVWDLVKDTPLAPAARAGLTGAIALRPGLSDRLAYMDREGIDYQAINVNGWGYAAERSLARDLVQLQNEHIATVCGEHPDRFVGMATVALQHPDLAADQLESAVRTLGLRGAAIGGSVEGVELSDRRFDPFWASAERLGVVVFMHPQNAPGTTQNARLQGRGALGNTIGNPLETTVFLSHLIFEGVLDRFPGLKICAAHAGGYLPSYTGRSDALCGRGGAPGADCNALQRKPSEYFRGPLFIDSMVFREEGLRHLVAEVGADHIVYGTDYPYDWPVGIDFILGAPFLSDAEKIAILGGNLKTLLRIG
jgi:aminocarboxymuconate-semialdehyde decarboxylase